LTPVQVKLGLRYNSRLNEAKIIAEPKVGVQTDSSIAKVESGSEAQMEVGMSTPLGCASGNSSDGQSKDESFNEDDEEHERKIKELKKMKKNLLKEKKQLEQLEHEKELQTKRISSPIKIKISRSQEQRQLTSEINMSNENSGSVLDANKEDTDAVQADTSEVKVGTITPNESNSENSQDSSKKEANATASLRINLGELVRNCKTKLGLANAPESTPQINEISTSSNKNNNDINLNNNLIIKNSRLFHENTSGRTEIWNKIIKKSKESPFFGHGSQADRWYINRSETFYNNASSAFFYALICGGALGVLIYLLILYETLKLVFLIFARKKYFFINSNLLTISSFFILIALLIRSLVENSFMLFSVDNIFFLTCYYILSKKIKQIS
jgi:hypothetical protein